MATCSVVCARCGQLKPGSRKAEPGELVSHGLCPDCFDSIEAEERAWSPDERAEIRAMVAVAWGREALKAA